MTRHELRMFLSDWFCGCGRPEVALVRLRDLLVLADFRAVLKEAERLK